MEWGETLIPHFNEMLTKNQFQAIRGPTFEVETLKFSKESIRPQMNEGNCSDDGS